ncbi:MAG: ABC transporter substrate-binding protein [Candidatus Velthaea sp.]
MGKLRLSLACWDYDRTRALADGRVSVEGIDLVYQPLPVEETFFRMGRFREFDVAEMSLSSYLVSKFRDDPFVAIPVFPSRFFRHSCIFVNEGSGIRNPHDLVGKIVGVPEYQMTAPAWIRGILSDEYGVPVRSVHYRSGGEEEPNREEKIRLDLPPDIDLEPIGPGQTLSRMLESGEIDALHTARMPSCYARRAPGVKRLFEDYVPVERAYYEKTGIFPIMHTVVIRRELYERDRWIAMALAKAFARAQAFAYADLRETAALKTMLPWSVAEADRTRALMGEDFWPYGFAANERTLEPFTRYSFE